MMRAASQLAVVAALLVAGVAPTWAQDDGVVDFDDAIFDDYDSVSQKWNCLHTLAAIAKGLGLSVESTREIDWDDLGSEDILLVLYPTSRLEPGHLAAFIRNGGQVMLADDFGFSSEALGRLGMLRQTAHGVAAQRFHRDLPFAPIARPLIADHPLAAGVEELTTNHPAILVQVRGPRVVFGFGDDEGVVAAGELGRGRFVVSSDPSILINRMLQFEGNMQFAINMLRYLSRDGQARRLVVLVGEFSLYGEPSNLLDDGTVRGTVSNILGEFNRWLDERNDYLLTQVGMRAVAVIVAALIALLALASLPLTRKTRLDGRWTQARGSSPAPDDFEAIVARYDRPGQSNYLLPATVVRDTINHALARVFDETDPLYLRKEKELADMLEKARGKNAAAAWRNLSKRLKSLPSRAQAASPWSTGQVTRREFQRLSDDATALYLALENKPG